MSALRRLFALLRALSRWALRLAILTLALMIGLTALWTWKPAISTLMAGRYLTFRPVDRQWVPLSRIAPSLPAAVIMSEDGQFCRHRGVDWDALSDVMNAAGARGPARGASTITMQTVKNLYLWPSRSAIRKGLEIPLALGLDAVWTKRRIMETYLNIAEWGEGLFGAEAAAQRYFHKSAAALSAHESALLVSALPNPFLRNPAAPGPIQRRVIRIIEARLRGAGPWSDCLAGR